jgi:hypothetical protein
MTDELETARQRIAAYRGCGHPVMPTAVWLLAEVERLTAENVHLTGLVIRNCDPMVCSPGDARPIEDILHAAEAENGEPHADTT